MQTDLVKWFVMPSVKDGYELNFLPYGRETHHLEGLKMNGSKAENSYHMLTDANMVFIKDKQGHPWDIKYYEEKGIFDWITELADDPSNWADPTAYKAFTPPLMMWDRTVMNTNTSLSHFSSVFTENKDGKEIGKSNVGEVFYTLNGPYSIAHGGNIGTLETYILNYYWNKADVREELYLTQEFGWCRWTTANKNASGIYVITDITYHNILVEGGCPKLVFPAFAIK